MLALARYSPDMNIKSPKVKARFVRKLLSNLKAGLRGLGDPFEIRQEWSCFFLQSDNPEAISLLKRTFGIGSFSVIEKTCPSDIESMSEVIRQTYGPLAEGKTICVRVRRAPNVSLNSQELEVHLGGILGSFARGVDLSYPELKVTIEVGEKEALFHSHTEPGAKGLPVGIEGRALCMISGGFDSPVAAWQMLKRGVTVDFVLFNMADNAYVDAVKAIVKAIASQWMHGVDTKLFIIDFEPMIHKIRSEIKPRYGQIALKRAFYRCGHHLAQSLEDCPALVTGESIGQVSSQTLHNLVAIESVTKTPILRPLLCADKEEILTQARHIGTFVLSEHIKEYCAITPKHPVTKTDAATIEREEAGVFEEEDFVKLSQTAEMFHKRDILHFEPQDDDISCQEIPKDAVVIDVREQSAYQRWHYPEALNIEIERLKIKYRSLDPAKTYVLYCSFGLQSAVLARRFKDKGLKVYNFKGGASQLLRQTSRRTFVW